MNDSHIFFALAAIMVMALATAQASSNDNFYDLALQKCNSSAPWTLHGLWPQWGTCCQGPPYNQSAMQPIIHEMNKYWPSCPQYDTTNEQLWSHEWQKHGTCTGLEQTAYFQEGINLLLSSSSKCTSSSTSCSQCFTTAFEPTSYSNCQTSGTFPDC